MPRFDALIQNGRALTLSAADLEETRLLGRELGEMLAPGTVICLYGDLGSGKTSFVQGLALGLGVPEEAYVTSPSYTLINEYEGRLPLYHLDLYRLSGSDELWDLGIDEIIAGEGVVAIEWPDRLPAGLAPSYLRIDIVISPDDTRMFTFTSSGSRVKHISS